MARIPRSRRSTITLALAPTNRVLAALPRNQYRRFVAACDPIDLPFGKILYESGTSIRYVYFPIDCLVSLLTSVESHRVREVGVVGREGMVGIPLALGTPVSQVRALVQGAGMALRMTSARFLSEYRKFGHLHGELNRYIHELMVQIAQTAACNVSHPVEARLARWLLMSRDRMGTDRFPLTHDLLGSMLGVLRGAVTHAAGGLQRRKLIRYSRGNITILRRAGLEAAACHCYQIVKASGGPVRRGGRAPRAVPPLRS